MPIPFIIIWAIFFTVAAISLVFNWDTLKENILGNNVVILGTKGVGKTTIHSFLRKGTIDIGDNKATFGQENVPKNTYKLGDLKLKLKKGVDIGGADRLMKSWKPLFMDCDICIYVFDLRKVYEGDKEHEKKILNQLIHIGSWHREKQKREKKKIPLFLFGLFVDQIPGFKRSVNIKEKEKLQELQEVIHKKLKKSFLQINIPGSKFIIGSMSNKNNAEFLIKQFLKQLS